MFTQFEFGTERMEAVLWVGHIFFKKLIPLVLSRFIVHFQYSGTEGHDQRTCALITKPILYGVNL